MMKDTQSIMAKSPCVLDYSSFVLYMSAFGLYSLKEEDPVNACNVLLRSITMRISTLSLADAIDSLPVC